MADVKIEIVSIKMKKEGILHSQYSNLSNVETAEKLIRSFIGDKDREHLVVITLDVKNHPTSITSVSIGSLNSSIAHPREIFKTAILANSASIIIGHNHPSGDTKPSVEDISITKRLVECGIILGIEILDHIIIGDDDNYISLRREGYI